MAVPDSNDKLWYKFTLDQIHCVEKLVYYSSRRDIPQQTWTCPNTPCTCQGLGCSDFSLKVSNVKPLPQNLPSITDCVYGDTLTLEKIQVDQGQRQDLLVREILIIRKEGEILETGR
jgi:hypothetical protein